MKYGIRTVLLRIGLVLSKDGGVLKKLYPIFKLFLGVSIGSGRQTISWIHIKDLVDFILKSIGDNKISGVHFFISAILSAFEIMYPTLTPASP